MDRSSGAFPLVIAAFSTIAALALFSTSTVQAFSEHEHLTAVEMERSRLRHETRGRLNRDALHRISQQFDIQSLLVELDRRGVYPGTILSQVFPSVEATDGR
jgi:hypothetical protein